MSILFAGSIITFYIYDMLKHNVYKNITYNIDDACLNQRIDFTIISRDKTIDDEKNDDIIVSETYFTTDDLINNPVYKSLDDDYVNIITDYIK